MTIPPTPGTDAPSAARLLRSTLLALGVAVLILITIVLPAEYGVDPTRVGRVLGLTQMGEIKMQLAREAAADAAADAEAARAEEAQLAAQEAAATASAPPDAAPATAPDTGWRDVTVVTLAPDEGKEVKLVMAEGAVARYAWRSEGGPVNHDTHGDSTGAPRSYHRYARGTGVVADSGQLVAAMDGSHGWFWRNRSGGPVTVTLRTGGAYAELKKRF
jgi:hypothetical protein